MRIILLLISGIFSLGAAHAQVHLDFTSFRLTKNNSVITNSCLIRIQIEHEPIGETGFPPVTPAEINDLEIVALHNSNPLFLYMNIIGGVSRKNSMLAQTENYCLTGQVNPSLQNFKFSISELKIGTTNITLPTILPSVTSTVGGEGQTSPIFFSKTISFQSGGDTYRLSFVVRQIGISPYLDYNLYLPSVSVPLSFETKNPNIEFCNSTNTNSNAEHRIYSMCSGTEEEDSEFEIKVSIDPFNMSGFSTPTHIFRVSANGGAQQVVTPAVDRVVSELVDIDNNALTESVWVSYAIYKLHFPYVPPENPQNNACLYPEETVYDVTICEFSQCSNTSSNTCCKDGSSSYTNRRVSRARFLFKISRKLESVDIEDKAPCEAPVNNYAWKSQPTGDYLKYGFIRGNMCERSGGVAPIYYITLCRDNDPDDNEFIDDGCSYCDFRIARSNESFGFYNLPNGQYKLNVIGIGGLSSSCDSYEEIFDLPLLGGENAIKLAVTPSPAFICPSTDPNIPSEVTVSANTDDFENYSWTHQCTGLTSSGSTHTYTVPRGKGGWYTLTASDSYGCLQRVDFKVIDLNIPELEYYTVDGVLSTGAVKFEHTVTPVLSSIPWTSVSAINEYDRKNSYLSGKSGIYRAKKTYDYLDLRSLKIVQESNVEKTNADILKSGDYDHVSIFNFQHPGMLVCEPSWKLNNTITRYNMSSYPVENRDILGNYSASLYGYDGKLQIAVAQNSSYREMAFESFEEYNSEISVNQLNNVAGNFDLVNQIVKGDVIDYEEYPIKIGMSNYAVIDMPSSSACPGNTFIADVICRSITSEPIGCNGSKAKEGEVDRIEVVPLENPCGIADIGGVLVRFPDALVPPFIPSPEDECLPWDGILRVRGAKSYAQQINYSGVSFTDERAHTGKKSMKLLTGTYSFENKEILLQPDKEYLLSFWVSTGYSHNKSPEQLKALNAQNNVGVNIITGSLSVGKASFFPKGPAIEGWQKVDAVFKTGAIGGTLTLVFDANTTIYIDDIRFAPLNAGIQTYVYNPENYRLLSVLDQNNYATVYRYDDEGNLFLLLKETVEGYKTIQMNQGYIKNNN